MPSRSREKPTLVGLISKEGKRGKIPLEMPILTFVRWHDEKKKILAGEENESH
jgi:hypothetical protein